MPIRMGMRRSRSAMLAAALLLSGCSFINDSLMPSLTGEEPSRKPERTGAQVSIPPSAAEQNPQPTLTQRPATGGGASYQVAAAPAPGPALGAPGSPTGTYVGQKVGALRGDVQRLQASINQHNQDFQGLRQQMAADAGTYYNLVAAISSRLQIGTTAANPELVAQWNQAQTSLDRLADDITKLNVLSSNTASDSSLAAYIRESVRATYALPGALDEDHHQLDGLLTEIDGSVVQIGRLLEDINGDISRQNIYVSNERRNLAGLAVAVNKGDLYGSAVANRGAATATPAAAQGGPASQQPLMVIRFNRPKVDYEQALYRAVSRALEKRPSATFDLMAVSPSAGGTEQVALNANTSKRNAEAVMRSLTEMGLPAERISLSASTSAAARSSEVQVFVR